MSETIAITRKVRHLLFMTYKVYRDRGFFSAVRRVFVFLKENIRVLFVKPSNILYISGCPGGSRFYRCENQAEEMKNFNIKASIASQDVLGLLALTNRFQVFVFQRVIFNEHIKNVIDAIKNQNKAIFFETDDLVFDPSYLPHMDYYNHMGDEERGWYENGIGREILEDSYVKNCIVSTDFLAQAMKKKYPDKEVFISYNKLNRNQVRMANSVFFRKSVLKKNDGKIRIGYFSGSKSHNKDFEAVAPILLKILQGNKDIVLRVVGYLDMDKEFSSVKSQIEHIGFVSLKKLQELIATVDINIAPLEIDNPFCQAKSALKYFEAGILGVPTIATATPDFVRCIQDGVNGFIARDDKEWEMKLKRLISDGILREKIGVSARNDVLLHHTTKKKHESTEVLSIFILKKDR